MMSTNTPEYSLCGPDCNEYYSPDHWQTRKDDAYESRQLWFPLADAVTTWESRFHMLMLHDRLRMEEYRKAIYQAVRYLLGRGGYNAANPVRVMDVGAGYGILSYWAVEAAAALRQTDSIRVYAVEVNSATAAQAAVRLDGKGMLYPNNGTGRILVLNTSSYHLAESLEENLGVIRAFDSSFPKEPSWKGFDLIVSETLGQLGDNEDTVFILSRAISDFLRKDGLVIPCELASYIVPITANPGSGNTGSVWDQAKNREFRTIDSQYRQQLTDENTNADGLSMFWDTIIPDEDLLAEPVDIKRWSFTYSGESPSDLPTSYVRKNLKFHVTRNGMFCGFKGYFKSVLIDAQHGGETVEFNIDADDIGGRRTSDCLKHLYLPIEHQIPVDEHDAISLDFSRGEEDTDHHTAITYAWGGKVLKKAGRRVVFGARHSVPFLVVRPHESWLAEYVKIFALQIEAAHLGAPTMTTADDMAANLFQHALQNQYCDVFLSRQAQEQELVDPDLHNLREGLKDLISKNVRTHLGECYIAWRSGNTWLWTGGSSTSLDSSFSATPPLGLNGAIEIQYSVKGSRQVAKVVKGGHPETIVKHFVTVGPRRFSARNFETIPKNEVFTGSLVIPEHIWDKMSVDAKRDLESLVYFIQLRFFIEVLSLAARRDAEAAVLSRTEAERHRQRAEDLLTVAATSHALKLPIGLALAHIRDGHPDKAAEILERRTGFIHLASRMKAKLPIECIALNEISSAPMFSHQGFISGLKEAAEYVANYLSVGDDVKRTANLVLDNSSDLLTWEAPSQCYQMCCRMQRNRTLRHRDPGAALALAFVDELYVNALKNSGGPAGLCPHVLVREEDHRLIVDVTNPLASREDGFETRRQMEVRADDPQDTILGLQIIKTAPQSLSWDLNVYRTEVDGVALQHFKFQVPIVSESWFPRMAR